MKFDIAAKLVSASQRAWVVHAGRSQQNYQDFSESNMVYLEAPYLELERETLLDKNALRRAIRRAGAWQRFHETTGSSTPSQELWRYSDRPFKETYLTALHGSIGRLFRKAKVGDLVIVPGREHHEGLFRPVIRIGEITTSFVSDDVHSGGRTSTQKVPFRRVKWLRVVARRDLSLSLERRIGKPPAIREIKIEKETEELLKYAYSSYIFDGSSSSAVEARKYDGSDFVTLNKSSELIAFLVSAHAVFSQDGIGVDIVNDMSKFTMEHFKEAHIENIEIEFASPGYWRIVGASATLAAFVGLGVAVLTSGLSIDVLAEGIVVENSVSANDGAAKALQESMSLMLKSMDKLELEKAVKTASDAKEIIGLQSSTQLVDK
jgi:hypothetical protein